MSINMNGKICLVTGANSGIGKVTALELAKMGAKVVMFCRNPKKGEDTLAEIKQKSGNSTVDLMIADLASLDSVRQFVTDFKAKYNKLHILIN
ncbi:MAG: SDR family NAD(P)-dependent oxidoreductase, partial [Candidatus Hodarchaeota archaeon]